MQNITIKGKLAIASIKDRTYAEFCVEDQEGNYYFIADDDKLVVDGKTYQITKSVLRHSASIIDPELPSKPIMPDGTIMDWTPEELDTAVWFSLFKKQTPCELIQETKHIYYYDRKLEAVTKITEA